ncbi:tyrosyl-DNA phosphodiesterase-domain-containing protein [Halteromyces radiatus]|uniref:tyrosyl-DNA phosphodiesterase-domain-containing protein n=1 Tax=Halteromyces radiatus TaxID=101107 RepID=UPI00221E8BAB|nr:tyrosyl-DNA phosphodiesterase-domain-containing protein [Halteromyces radiatus]KAI8089946.1 tyrosyl-DNA phosphodiesterase-domain-containing protein [Halteromyces radiatus]
MCIVSHGRPAMRKQFHPNRILIIPPLKDDRYGCFHIKLMLLFHQDSMRVVIGSANLESYDYNDLENVVFIQDFPNRSDDKSHSSDWKDLPRFANDLCELLDEMHVPTSVKEEMARYDFTKASAHIVASVSGIFEGDNKHRKYGHTRLADIITEMGAADPSRKPKVEMQTSSLGALSKSYLQELYTSFCGIHPHSDQNKSKRKTDSSFPPIDIIYPSMDTVNSSRLGPSGASTICLNRTTWQKSTFPKEIMCDSISHRPGTLMHSKRSHNATTSAWGKLTLSKQTKQPKMNISNWELGVVLPITDDSDFPSPYIRPAPRYKPGQQAWTQDMDY